jgi:two-component system NtrC family sensor kinase
MARTSEGRDYRRLRRNMSLVVVGVSLIPLALTGWLVLAQFERAYRQKVWDHLGELVQKHRQEIDAFLADRLADIRVLARTASLPELIDDDFLHRRLALLQEEYRGVYVDLGMVDEAGLQRVYAGPHNLYLANYAQAAWFQKAIRAEHYLSDVFTGLRGTPHFLAAVRLGGAGRDFLLRATIDFEAFNALVESLRLGRTGFAFILNQAGEFQTKPRFEVLPSRGPYLDFLRSRPEAREVTIVEAENDLGRRIIYAMASLKAGEWVLCVQQDADEALARLKRAGRSVLAIFLGGLALIALMAVLVSRRMVARLAQADEDQAALNQRLLQTGRLAAIGELAAGVAHEINNPVALMVEEAGWIGDLAADEDLEAPETRAELTRAVAQIKTQGRRCKAITHKLLSFARETDPEVKAVDLNALAQDVFDLLSQKSRYAKVILVPELAPGLPAVAGSPSELQQVLLNLVNNAVDAIGPEGGTVTVATRAEGEEVVLTVTDTGTGIP